VPPAREGHRRKFSEADKRRIVEEAVQPGASLSEVADLRPRSEPPLDDGNESSDDFRGRDASYLAPPAQIRASPIRAHGSHLGYVTARRDILTKFRMRFSACDTVPRYCARPVLC